MDERLRALGLTPAASEANFCWFDLGGDRDEDHVVSTLAKGGVIVRAGAALGRRGALRVTYGTPGENARFLEVLGQTL
jgi:histidinol-phosphate aminotransferase